MESLSRTTAIESPAGRAATAPKVAAGPPPRLYGLLEEFAGALLSPPSGPALLLLAEADLEFLRCVKDLPADTSEAWEVRVLWEDVRRLGRSDRLPETARALDRFWMMLDAWLRGLPEARTPDGAGNLAPGAGRALCGEAA